MTGPAFTDHSNAGRISRSSLAVVLVSQLVLLAVVAVLIACYRSTWALSFLAGGAIHIVPVTYFGWYMFKDVNSAAVNEVVQAFYRSEMVKFFLTALGFALAFKLLEPLHVPALFAGYGLMIVAHTIGVARLSR